MPLCHPLALTRVAVEFDVDARRPQRALHRPGRDLGRTGVEMEALTAVQVGLLTIYDMCKAVDRGMVIGDVRVLEKHGGKSGDWVAAAADRARRVGERASGSPRSGTSGRCLALERQLAAAGRAAASQDAPRCRRAGREELFGLVVAEFLAAARAT